MIAKQQVNAYIKKDLIKLSRIPTSAPKDLDKEKIKKETVKIAEKIGNLINIISAEKKHSLLIVIQGMDASGKDGTIENTLCFVSPTNLQVYGFKKPTEEEFAHDFLWRCHKLAPKKGKTMVFVRSHYEDILIQKVHGWIDNKKLAMRMDAINSFERTLKEDNNTTVVKLFLHISPKVQLEKLQERKDDPLKNWKHNDGDWEERKHWKKYMNCYEYALNHADYPWHIIPADQRWYRNHMAAKAIYQSIKKLNPTLPILNANASHNAATKKATSGKKTTAINKSVHG